MYLIKHCVPISHIATSYIWGRETAGHGYKKMTIQILKFHNINSNSCTGVQVMEVNCSFGPRYQVNNILLYIVLLF